MLTTTLYQRVRGNYTSIVNKTTIKLKGLQNSWYPLMVKGAMLRYFGINYVNIRLYYSYSMVIHAFYILYKLWIYALNWTLSRQNVYIKIILSNFTVRVFFQSLLDLCSLQYSKKGKKKIHRRHFKDFNSIHARARGHILLISEKIHLIHIHHSLNYKVFINTLSI